MIDGPWEGRGRLSVLDLESGHEQQLGVMAEFHGMELSASEVASFDFTPDGSRVLAAGGDDQLRIWDLATGREILSEVEVSPGGEGSIDHERLQFLADGRLVTGWGSVLDGRPLSDAVRVEREAFGVVHHLRRLPRSRAEIIAAIDVDPTISQEVRRRAIDAASDLSDESSELIDQCWHFLDWPHRPSSVWEMVERTGGAIQRADPRHPWGRAIRGAALFRLGRHAEAAEALPGVVDLPQESTPSAGVMRALIYRALALARLGRVREARTALGEVDRNLKTKPALEPPIADLAAEARPVVLDAGFPANPFAQ